MNSSLKNIVVLLVILTFAFVGYYIFVQNDSQIDFTDNSNVSDEILAKTSLFIERRAILDKVVIDTSVFEDPLFISYRNFTLPVSEQVTGRENPFLNNSDSKGENNF